MLGLLLSSHCVVDAISCFSTLFTWQTYNALFIIRNLCKYFVENLTEDVVLEQFRSVCGISGLYNDFTI